MLKSINIDKHKLRTDGIYVQFGYRPWNSWLGYAGDCWYNLLKVVDDNNLILLGSFNRNPFFEIDELTHKPIERKYCLDKNIFNSCYDIPINEEEQESFEKKKINNLELKFNLINNQTNKMNLSNYYEKIFSINPKDKPKFFSIYRKDDDYWEKQFIDGLNTINSNGTITYGKCEIIDESFPSVIHYNNSDEFEVIKDFYSYLELDLYEDNFDVISIVKKLQNFNWNSLDNKIKIKGIDQITNYYIGQKNNNDNDNNDNDIIKLMVISNCSSNHYNDPFSLINYSNDVNSFYIKYSHCWIEGELIDGGNKHYKYGDEEINGEQIPFKILTNSFKFTFVPYDFSEKNIWIDEYIKWKERFEYHKYYIGKNENK